MGHGVVSRPLGGSIMRELSEEYEKLSKLGYGDFVVQEKLEAKYRNFIEMHASAIAEAARPEASAAAVGAVPVVSATVAPVASPLGTTTTATNAKPTAVTKSAASAAGAAPAPVGQASPAIGLGKGKPRLSKKGTDSGGARRKSFEAAKVVEVAASGTMAGSASTSALKTTGANAPPAAPVAGAMPPGNTAEAAATTAAGASGSAEIAGLVAVAAAAGGSEERRDNWDSVSQMPFCDACKMAFKTPSLLDRHIKYSELHASTLKKLQDTPLTALDSPEVAIQAQREGVDYKLLYTGSKFFWRTQENITLSFYHHILPDCIEVVPFDPEKNKALDRIYLSMSAMTLSVAEEVTTAKSSNGKATSGKDKFSQPKASDEEIVRKVITTAILARLQLVDATELAAAPATSVPRTGKTMQFVTSDLGSPLLPRQPVGLVPVSVTHRRNTSQEEVSAKMHELQVSKAELVKATSRAEKVVTAVQSFAKNMKAQFVERSKMSAPRKKWIMAINRILQINSVKTTVAVLAAIEARAKGVGGDGKRRERAGPGSSSVKKA